MMKLLVVFFTLFVQLAWSQSYCGSYATKGRFSSGYSYSIPVKNGERTFDMYLYYPSTKDGENAPYNQRESPYPVIAFAHGLLQPDFEYLSYMKHFSSHGYFVVAPRADYSLLPDMNQFASDVRASIDYIQSQNNNKSSWLYNQVDVDHVGITGHSLGGFATVLSAVYPSIDSRIKVIAPIAGSPVDKDSWKNITIPTMVVSGSDDLLAPSEYMIDAYKLASFPKIEANVIGGWHCGFMDESIELPDFLCRSPEGWMYRAEQLELTRCLLTPLFDLYLKHDQAALPYVWGPSMSYGKVAVLTDPGMALTPKYQTQEDVKNTANFTIKFTNTGKRDKFIVRMDSTSSFRIEPTQLSLDVHQTAEITVSLFMPSNPMNSIETGTIYVTASDGLSSTFSQVVACSVHCDTFHS